MVIFPFSSSVVVVGQNQPDQSSQTEVHLQAIPQYSGKVSFFKKKKKKEVKLKLSHLCHVIFWSVIMTAKMQRKSSKEVQLKCP